jgi:5-(carboxyamino)imidazole ribonucleotide mutase
MPKLQLVILASKKDIQNRWKSFRRCFERNWRHLVNFTTKQSAPMKVMIIMGSQTDESVMQECSKWLNWFGIENNMVVASAHRNPDKVRELMVTAKDNGYGVIIAAAGMAAALPGVCSAYTSLPVLGVPLDGGLPGGIDALYSIVQMPAGLPVGTLAVGKAGARNAAVLAARIIALSDAGIAKKVEEFKANDYRI